LNLLDLQLSPAEIPQKVFMEAEAIAMLVVKELGSPGLFAVEFFVDMTDDVFVNEQPART